MNDSPETTATLLWETAKAVLRGKIISYASYKKKKDIATEKDLEEKLKKKYMTHMLTTLLK